MEEDVTRPEVGEDFWAASSRETECVTNERSRRSCVEKVKVDVERKWLYVQRRLDFSVKDCLFTKGGCDT